MSQLSDHQSIQQMRGALRSIRNQPHSAAYSLAREFYTDPAWLQLELSELFSHNWICVGRVDEVAQSGDYFTYDLGDDPLLIVRGDDGNLRALVNVCRHRGTVIAQGRGKSKKFICPYHHWVYANNGELLNAPHVDGHQSFDPSRCRLPEWRTEVWQGFIFVNQDPLAPALAPALEPLRARIKPYHLEAMHLRYFDEVVWETNWKCLLENFMEGYHLTPLHQDTLHRVNPSRLCRHFPPGDGYFGYQVGFTSRVPQDRVGHPDLSASEQGTCIMFAVAPGLVVGVGSDYCSFLCLRPLAPAQVGVKMGLFFFGDRWSETDIDAAIELFRQTMDEDKQVLLRLQRGLQSRHHAAGPLAAVDLEGTVWDFYQYLSRNLGH